MSRNARRLVKKLNRLGYIVYGASFHILRYQYQEHLNTLAGECAPTWELLVEPLRDLRRIIKNGREPTFDMPDGTRHTTKIYSFYPLTHILKTPIDQWEVALDDAWIKRLLITTHELPDTWAWKTKKV
jgi:hypothetical protein